MTLECRIDQGAGRRAVEGCLSMKLNGKPGNPWLAETPKSRTFSTSIELAQIVVDQMDGEIGRLLHWIHARASR